MAFAPYAGWKMQSSSLQEKERSLGSLLEIRMKYVVVALMSLSLPLSVFGETYTSTYLVSCSEVWGGIKDTLSNPESYTVVKSDDAEMTASCHVKHTVHVTITGAVLQRKN
jgi:hypothetical protein